MNYLKDFTKTVVGVAGTTVAYIVGIGLGLTIIDKVGNVGTKIINKNNAKKAQEN